MGAEALFRASSGAHAAVRLGIDDVGAALLSRDAPGGLRYRAGRCGRQGEARGPWRPGATLWEATEDPEDCILEGRNSGRSHEAWNL